MYTFQSATIKDVAQKAGVSVGTVSRVLNKHSDVSVNNVKKVMDAVKTLNYRKCNAAQLLVSRRNSSRIHTGNIGVVFSEISPVWSTSPHISAYIQGIERAAEDNGYNFFVEWLSGKKIKPRCITEGKVDGLILETTHFENYVPEHIPVVAISSHIASRPIAQFYPDNRSAGWFVTDYLWQKGHRKIAFLSTSCTHPMFNPRYYGYEEYLRIKGELCQGLIKISDIVHDASTPEKTFPDVLSEIDSLLNLSSDLRPTAIIAANDWIAGGVYNALMQRDISIPDDISVVGFDNDESLCCAIVPSLTSYFIPWEDVAYAATCALLAQIDGEPPETLGNIKLISGNLVERNSVKALSHN